MTSPVNSNSSSSSQVTYKDDSSNSQRKDLIQRSRRMRQMERSPSPFNNTMQQIDKKLHDADKFDNAMAKMLVRSKELLLKNSQQDSPFSSNNNPDQKSISQLEINLKQKCLDLSKILISAHMFANTEKTFPQLANQMKAFAVDLEEDLKFGQKRIQSLLSNKDTSTSSTSSTSDASNASTSSTPITQREMAEKALGSNPTTPIKSPETSSSIEFEDEKKSSSTSSKRKNRKKKSKINKEVKTHPLPSPKKSEAPASTSLDPDPFKEEESSAPTIQSSTASSNKKLDDNLRLYKPSNRCKELPRVTRWLTKDTDQIRQFVDTSMEGDALKHYEHLSDEEILEQRARHYLPGTERLLMEPEFRNKYTFPTNRGYGMLAQLAFNQTKTNGILYIGIDNSLIVFHKYFEDVQFSTSTTNWLLDKEGSNPNEAVQFNESWHSDFKFDSHLSDKDVFTFTYSDDHAISIYPLKPM